MSRGESVMSLDASAAQDAPTRQHQPALDGLRGIAVMAVLLFHAGFDWMSGGYLGVSVFFTLSGFLITRLLLDEHTTSGRIDLVRFANRRLRRLLPASLICLTLIIIGGAVGWFDTVANLRRDIIAAALQVANWGQLTVGRSYADLFKTGTSPVTHYWSLAVEEQFYLVWPLAFAGVMFVLRRQPQRLLPVLGVLFVASALTPAIISSRWSADAVYFATPARLAELLAGALLAVAIQRRPEWLSLFRRSSAGASRFPASMTVAALALIFVAFVVTPAGRGWAYSGGLPLFGLVSAALIAGLQVAGPVRSLLSFGLLVRLGRISYGVYLYHWPVFVVADQRWGGLGTGWLFAVEIAITLTIAIASYVLVEQPVRRGPTKSADAKPSIRAGSRSVDFLAAVAATALVCVVALTLDLGGASTVATIDAGRAEAVAIQPVEPQSEPQSPPESANTSVTATNGATASPSVPSVQPDSERLAPARILVVGDSTALSIGDGLVDWAFDNRELARVSVMGLGGCGLVIDGLVGTVVDLASRECGERVREEIPAAVQTLRPDVVVVSINVADNWDRSFDGGETFVRPTDPHYSGLIRDRYRAFFDDLVAAQVPHVVWLNPPVASVYGRDGIPIDPAQAAAGQQLVDAAVDAAAALHPNVVTELDLDRWLQQTGLLADPATRPDDVHLSESAASRVVDEWLAPQLLELVGRDRTVGPG